MFLSPYRRNDWDTPLFGLATEDSRDPRHAINLQTCAFLVTLQAVLMLLVKWYQYKSSDRLSCLSTLLHRGTNLPRPAY
ncbi:hypothetical protein BDR04DRAFT_1110859 [Suillus decipiens]|nr:hypothetical protein BDR04DRAFT_1110859 [Suillus decipiens]